MMTPSHTLRTSDTHEIVAHIQCWRFAEHLLFGHVVINKSEDAQRGIVYDAVSGQEMGIAELEIEFQEDRWEGDVEFDPIFD